MLRSLPLACEPFDIGPAKQPDASGGPQCLDFSGALPRPDGLWRHPEVAGHIVGKQEVRRASRVNPAVASAGSIQSSTRIGMSIANGRSCRA